MTAYKITDLTATTTLANGDLLVVVTDPVANPATKKITYSNFFANVVSNAKFSNTVTFANTVTFSKNVTFSNTITFPLNIKMGANIEGDPNGFDLYAPSTLGYMSLTYGAEPTNGTATYINIYKDGNNANTSPHVVAFQVYTGNPGDSANWLFNGTDARLTLPDNGSIYFPDGSSQYIAFNTNTAYTFANTITHSANMVVSTNTLTLGTSTNAANGYTYLPNGFKLNWGWVSANSSAGNVTFSSAYTTNVYVVTATSNSAVTTYQAAVISQNNTVAAIRTANTTSTNVFWQAIGY